MIAFLRYFAAWTLIAAITAAEAWVIVALVRAAGLKIGEGGLIAAWAGCLGHCVLWSAAKAARRFGRD